MIELSNDMRRLIIAARNVAFDAHPSPEALKELDAASEAFAEVVGWDDAPVDFSQLRSEALWVLEARSDLIEQCAKIVEPAGPRPCDCDRCYCGNIGDAEAAAAWDSDAAHAKAIRALSVKPHDAKGGAA